ncbi:MAG: hypothetical protein H0V64_09595 [Geodermatophilaceae bacterium]|nr:hypothetical protein [Geodermatophilaceae bacterium]
MRTVAGETRRVASEVRRQTGHEHVRRTGSAILVVNHISLLDPFSVARFGWDAGRIPGFLVKDSLFWGAH